VLGESGVQRNCSIVLREELYMDAREVEKVKIVSLLICNVPLSAVPWLLISMFFLESEVLTGTCRLSVAVYTVERSTNLAWLHDRTARYY
jgi:hypothetical protein